MDMMDSCRSQASSIPNGVVLEVFTREYLMKALVDFPPSRKGHNWTNGDQKWAKMECTGTHSQVRCVYPFWDNAHNYYHHHLLFFTYIYSYSNQQKSNFLKGQTIRVLLNVFLMFFQRIFFRIMRYCTYPPLCIRSYILCI